MKLEIRETVNDLRYGNHFEVYKDGIRMRGFYYGVEADLPNVKREDSLKRAEDFYETLKYTNSIQTTVIKSEEI